MQCSLIPASFTAPAPYHRPIMGQYVPHAYSETLSPSNITPPVSRTSPGHCQILSVSKKLHVNHGQSGRPPFVLQPSVRRPVLLPQVDPATSRERANYELDEFQSGQYVGRTQWCLQLRSLAKFHCCWSGDTSSMPANCSQLWKLNSCLKSKPQVVWPPVQN